MIFATQRFYIRELTANDADDYFSLHGDEEIMRYIRAPKSRDVCDKMLLDHIAINKILRPFGRWLVFDNMDDSFIGSFVVIPVEGTQKMQLGYSVLKNHWGKGVATELVGSGLQYIFTNSQLDFIYAIVEDQNIASKKVLVNAGFVANQIMLDGDKSLVEYIYERDRWTAFQEASTILSDS
ncbi:MAG: GNAT family N-acetyltransferase [Chitinophagaceae bacterium]|nr:GNAT family N-acetyltransferase [Chitinophagaceae bacterium]